MRIVNGMSAPNWWIAMFVPVMVSICGCLSQGSAPNYDRLLKYEVVSVDDVGNAGEVKVKITSMATREILRARITCIALDGSGREIDFATWYAIKAAEGLSPNESTYYNFLFDGPIQGAVSYSFKIKELDWR